MPIPNNNKNNNTQQQTTTTTTAPQQQQQKAVQGPTYILTQDEIVFIENVLVELRSLIPNDMGQNQNILEKIVLAEQIIGARLDPESAAIGDSA